MDNKDKKVNVIWVGLSDKKPKKEKKFYPLGEDTNSGKIIAKIEKQLPQLNFYRTNLVKFAPVDKNNKLRYPTNSEMEDSFCLLQNDILEFKPTTVFLLGNRVSEFVLNKKEQKLIKSKERWRAYAPVFINGVCFISIFHPSYVYVYKRKEIDDYLKTVRKIIPLI